MDKAIITYDGVFYCSRKEKCTWQGFALNHGLGWGSIPQLGNAWRWAHDERCEGVLIQLIEPAPAGNPTAEAAT